MRFLLAPVGSAGDVYPFLGLGVALQQRGHQVTLMTSGYFRDAADRADLPFVDCLPAQEFLASIAHPDLWHPLRGFRHVFRRCIAPHLQRHYELTLQHSDANTVLVSSCLGMGIRVAQETHARRLVTIHLQPAVLWSKFASPQLPNMPSSRWTPTWLKQALFTWGCKQFVDGVALPDLNHFRSQFGLTPIKSLMHWWNSPDAVIGFFPEWYAPPQPDWPVHVQLAVFPRWTDNESLGISTELHEFLQNGSPPILFTPGSAMAFGRRFFEVSAAACVRLNRRGLLVTQFPQQIPHNLPPTIQHVDYAPFGLLLDRVAAIVHHGGIGTTSQALAAGIPQLIMPMSHDQPDNAARLRRLGVGDSIQPRRFTSRRVAAKLARLLNDPHVALACQQTAHKMHLDTPFDIICQQLETTASAWKIE
ncbi:MAG: glycosyltransferase [Planctomycetota bacterium]|nr:glycosyltransferase [Planctomycetota bacterium]MDA1179414.1 glycosyltransferase [Planctomycetota bacterium]